MQENIKAAYENASSYPELVTKLIAVGVESYTVDVASGNILYRFAAGEHILHYGSAALRVIAGAFNEVNVIKAIRDNQQKKSTYPEFMDAIAQAGVRFYEATLTGNNKRVSYIGVQEKYEENIPV